MILKRILTPFGWVVLIGLLGVLTGICTGLYSCRHTLKEAVTYETQELPIAHSFEVAKEPQKTSKTQLKK